MVDLFVTYHHLSIVIYIYIIGEFTKQNGENGLRWIFFNRAGGEDYRNGVVHSKVAILRLKLMTNWNSGNFLLWYKPISPPIEKSILGDQIPIS